MTLTIKKSNHSVTQNYGIIPTVKRFSVETPNLMK
nr:MAG TPA: hypothetical protein [Caudoviricetes sp.]